MSAVTTDQAFADWAKRAAGIEHACLGRELAGGNANVTRLATAGDRKFVVRHPPAATVSDRAAAGIAREYRFISAISGQARVPTPIAYCEDASVLGAPFAMVEHVAGTAITDTLPLAYCDSSDVIDTLGHELVDGIAEVHAIDPAGLNLGDPEKARSFVMRQIERWRAVRLADAVRDLPEVEALGQWLANNAPDPETVRIVHCDYHLDNVLMDEGEPRLNAIIDWEMATLADPLVDLGLVTAMWNRSPDGPTGFPFVQQVSNRPDAVSGDALARRWAQRTGLSIAALDYYRCFALWRLAAIVEGAYVLYRQGKVDGAYESGLEHDVPALLAQARQYVGEGGYR